MAFRWRCWPVCAFLAISASHSMAQQLWAVFEGVDGLGHGKHVVLISGDEEYRSEEALPQLAKILATHHGFTCSVLFAIHPETGIIDPNYSQNIPGLDALDNADLMIIFTRFRALADDQMEHIDRYLRAGKPVIGMRTATHAFKFPENSRWNHYSNGYTGDRAAWNDGFGRLVLGEMWISHHGKHKYESTRGVAAPGANDHPILRGIVDVWAPTDVYGVRLPLSGDSVPLLLGQVLEHPGAFDDNDLLYGMRPETGVAVNGEKNDPMMPIAFTKSYEVPGGKKGRAFTTTMGASTDLLNEGVRRLLVNAVYWCLGMEVQIPAEGTNVNLVGEYTPTKFEFRESEYWEQRKMSVSEVVDGFE